MKPNEQPVLTYKWWDAGRAKTLPKTGVGDAFKAYEAALKVKDPQLTRKRIAELDLKIKKAIDKADKRLHAETIAALQKCVVLLKKEDDKVVIEIRNAVQKPGKPLVIWSIDVSDKVTKQVDPAWLQDFRGHQLSLWLDDQLAATLRKEGDLATPAFMVEDAQKIGDAVVKDIVGWIKSLDAEKGKTPQQLDAQREKLKEAVAKRMAAAEKELLVAPKKRWDAFAARHSQYRTYQFKSGAKVTLGAVKLVSGAAGIVGTGGAALALGIVGMVRGSADIVKQVHDLWVEAESVGANLKKDCDTLVARYVDAQGKAKSGTQGASEVGGTILKSLLGTDAPFVATLPKAKANYELWDNKIAGITSRGLKASQALTKTLERCDDLDKRIRNAQNPKVKAIEAKLTVAQKELDESLNKVSDLMGRVRAFEQQAPDIKAALDALDGSNPEYAKWLERILPAAVKVALGAGGATDAFTSASAALGKAEKALATMQEIGKIKELPELIG